MTTVNIGALIEAARQVVKAFDAASDGLYDECCWQRFIDADAVEPLREALGESK